jgi:predicted RNase H-like HicB family nuclease
VYNENRRDAEAKRMQTVKYIHWQEGDAWLGYLEEYPDYWTQGESFDDLIDHLKDLYLDLSGGQIPGARKVGELVLS